MDTLFFITSKFVWALIRPETITVLFVAVGTAALLLGHKKVAAAVLMPVSIIMALLAALPLGDAVLRPLETQFPPNPEYGKISGIIILGGAEEGLLTSAWGQPVTGQAGERFLAAIALSQKNPKARVIFSGGSGRIRGGPSGAEIAKDILLSAGINAERLVLEANSRNTAENAKFLLPIVKPTDGDRWLLLTSAYHMQRAVETFCATGWRGLVPYPVDYRSGGFTDRVGWNFAQNLDDLNTGVREWIGLWSYRWSGRSSWLAEETECLARYM
jgi:uncharacterized SAM-binding protein YcdF (DUF218 family)